jgi:hypothetical protein
VKGDPLDLLNPLPGELAVIHYVAPFGRQKKVFAPVGEEYVRKAEGMVASAEVLSTDIVALYLRWAEEPEEKELLRLARNGPGADSPNETLKRMIDELRERGRR